LPKKRRKGKGGKEVRRGEKKRKCRIGFLRCTIFEPPMKNTSEISSTLIHNLLNYSFNVKTNKVNKPDKLKEEYNVLDPWRQKKSSESS